jgi:hypothetical protein
VQYFENQGIVTDKRVTEDTEAQLVAGGRYLKIIGGYAKSGDDVQAQADANVEVKVILERIGSGPRVLEVRPNGAGQSVQEQPHLHPSRDDQGE